MVIARSFCCLFIPAPLLSADSLSWMQVIEEIICYSFRRNRAVCDATADFYGVSCPLCKWRWLFNSSRITSSASIMHGLDSWNVFAFQTAIEINTCSIISGKFREAKQETVWSIWAAFKWNNSDVRRIAGLWYFMNCIFLMHRK